MSARIGLFGGTFDPIHNGHLQVAVDVMQLFSLDSIYFIPCAIQPQKSTDPVAPALNRVEMLRMALEGHPGFAISEFEIQRGGPSYTIDTLRHFAATQPPGTRLFFILGIDAFLEIDTWKAYPRLFDLASFIVIARPGTDISPEQALRTAAGYTQRSISAQYRLDDHGGRLVHPARQPIYLAHVSQIDVASTHIRRSIRRGDSVRDRVNPDVVRYIEKKGLYR
jgi:nicotinate-nucleotide adenylyltransferase